MEDITFFNISPIQFFDSTQYSNDISNDLQNTNSPEDNKGDSIETNHHDLAINNDVIIDQTTKDSSNIDLPLDTDIELDSLDDEKTNNINMECLDNRKSDILTNLSCPVKVSSNTLNICQNRPEIPTGRKDGVIAKIPVVLAQLVIPIPLTSHINLPKKALEIQGIKKRLRLEKCTLMQPTNILYIRGFVNKTIQYSTAECGEDLCGGLNHCTLDIPFECSTAVEFFTEPLDPITNTKELFRYYENELSDFNQVSEEFFNETPFCKLLSSKIVQRDEEIKSNNLEQTFIEIEGKTILEIRMEILQNQPVVIAPSVSE